MVKVRHAAVVTKVQEPAQAILYVPGLRVAKCPYFANFHKEASVKLGFENHARSLIYQTWKKLAVMFDMTTNQMVSHCIDDWVDLAVSPQKTTTHRLSVARYALKITEDKSE